MPELEPSSENERLRREIEDLQRQIREVEAELVRLKEVEARTVELATRHLLA